MTPQKSSPPVKVSNVTVENARLAFRNFSGKEGRFNSVGNRNFCVLLDPDVAEDLKAIGWNIKWLKAKEEGDPDLPYIKISVGFRVLPPRIIVVTSKNKVALEEGSINVLDWAEIQNVDLIFRPYNWEVNGKTGIKAYLKTMYITLVEDDLEKKYMNVPDAAISHLIPPDEEDED